MRHLNFISTTANLKPIQSIFPPDALEEFDTLNERYANFGKKKDE